MRCLDSITDSMHINLSKLREIVEDRGAWNAALHGIAESDMNQTLNNNTTVLQNISIIVESSIGQNQFIDF